jgi:hypothetical protein
MKLKTIILLERGMSMGYGSMTSGDTKLRAMPGKENHLDDGEYWDGVTEGQGWFCYRESNNWDIKRSGASVTITEGDPHRFWIKIKTHGLKKPTDTNESYRQRVRKHVDKVSKAWITAARNLHNNPEINEVGNYLQKTWKECFEEALNDPKISSFVSEKGETKISPIADPVNFTPRV